MTCAALPNACRLNEARSAVEALHGPLDHLRLRERTWPTVFRYPSFAACSTSVVEVEMEPTSWPETITWTPEMDAALRAMRSRGESLSAVADRVGVSCQAVAKRCRVLGITTAKLNRGVTPGVRVPHG